MKHAKYRQTMFIDIGVFFIACLLSVGCDKGLKTYTIGVLNFSRRQEDTVKGFKEGMTELGYNDGENVTYLYEGAIGAIETLDAVAQKLVEKDIDLILSITTPATQAAQRAIAGTDIPIVFIPVTDPVGAGLVKSLMQPGGNMTGVTFGPQEGRRLEWLLQVAPTIKHIYIPYNPDDRSAVLALEMASEAAPKLGVELITRETRTTEEVMTAIEQIPEEADAIVSLPDSLVGAHIAELIEAALTRNLPTSGPNLTAVEDGHLTAYGIDIAVSARQQAARLADQILRGTKPADLPVETAEFYSAINLKTAEAIGLDIPNDILLQADIIIR